MRQDQDTETGDMAKRHDIRDMIQETVDRRGDTGDRYMYSRKKLWANFFFKYSSVAQFFDGANFLPLNAARWR